VHRDRTTAVALGKRAVGEMLPGFWALAQKQPAAREALLAGIGIGESDFAVAASRIKAGEDPVEVLDDRFANVFSLAGTPEDCLAAARQYAAAGVTDLALSFAGPAPLESVHLFCEALASHSMNVTIGSQQPPSSC
jgi:alkanesulfonate monooxygenase SsuD/methylene tetrahydromethanopterin reductase-like flavin-dependent oxidoreductase (luciferase family)